MTDSGVFLERAEQLAVARDFYRKDDDYPSAIALLSVHSAIALNDALLVELIGKRAGGHNHTRAARDTEAACKAYKTDRSGLKHLQVLLAKKSQISYSSTATSAELAESLARASERFQAWVFSILPSMRRIR